MSKSLFKLLDKVAEVIEARRADYGSPFAMFDDLANDWTDILGFEVTPAQVAACLMSLKYNRFKFQARNGKDTSDSVLDLCGYATLMHALLEDPDGRSD